ncbi:MAG: UDP-N-acetylmuramate dehydrogenase [Coriobacteriaceae bacterium]|nr:UDP-N-acetylmuramate dehydrogenase [Coriobacteriaceae bacterium]
MIDRIIDYKDLAEFLRDVVGAENVREGEPLSAHTTFKIGGPAVLYAMPGDPDQVRDSMALCSSTGTPYFVLGAGSNLLVSDDGFAGVIISLAERLTGISVDGCELTCQAGVLLKDASETACAHGLSGLEFACGIPGTVGGACFMNAGAYGGCIADVLKEVTVLTDGRLATLPVGELDLGYRHSRIADDGMVVVSATFTLTPGDPAEIRATMDDLTEQRTSKQPLELPSAGSTFKRPEGYFAGKLISDAGLKGFQLGGAAVSSKHAGFVVNVDGAMAADVCALIEHVQDEVEARFGVRLEPEVRMLGF